MPVPTAALVSKQWAAAKDMQATEVAAKGKLKLLIGYQSRQDTLHVDLRSISDVQPLPGEDASYFSVAIHVSPSDDRASSSSTPVYLPRTSLLFDLLDDEHQQMGQYKTDRAAGKFTLPIKTDDNGMQVRRMILNHISMETSTIIFLIVVVIWSDSNFIPGVDHP